MLSFLRQLAAVPVRLLAWICGFLPLFDRLALLNLVWRFTGEAPDGVRVIIASASEKGMAFARGVAEEIFSRCCDGRIAVAMGWLEARNGQDYEAARRWVEKGTGPGVGNAEYTLELELFLENRMEGHDASEVIERILGRNDLPMEVTRRALITRAGTLLGSGQWSEAELIADRILGIEENPDARFMKWVICRAKGELSQAEEHLNKVRAKLPDAALKAMMAQGRQFLGEKEKENR